MSRRNVRFILGALAVAGALAFAPSNAAAAGGRDQESGAGGLMRWVASLWQQAVVLFWEDSAQPGIPTNDEGWMVDPNG